MTASKESLRELHLVLNDKLCEIADLLTPAYKLTLIARHPTNPNAHIVTSDDNAYDAAHVLLHGKLPIVQGPATPEATASAAGGARVAQLEAALRKARMWVQHCDGLQRESFGHSLLPEIDALLSSPPPGRGARMKTSVVTGTPERASLRRLRSLYRKWQRDKLLDWQFIEAVADELLRAGYFPGGPSAPGVDRRTGEA